MNLPASIKPDNMKNLVNHFPQLLGTLQIDESILTTAKQYYKDGISGICFLGMGGSSIVGNYVKALFSETAKIPISVIRDYSLPAYVDNKWAVIAVSYSGNTAETLSSLSMATKLVSKIFIMTAGGKMAHENKYPIIHLPEGLQPRATLPLMLSAALPVVEILAGLKITELQHLEKILIEKSDNWNGWHQSPEEIANAFVGKVPLFIGSKHLVPVAYRAKCQINENSKALAFYSELPESNHNEIESFVNMYGCSIIPVFLRSAFELTELRSRFDVTYDLYNEMGLGPMNLACTGNTQLEEMLLLTHFLDMVSVEFAELRNVNPVSVERIEELKHRLSR
ncbi:MAG: bifunctional phosphoglucose/phosphomannose isomerase [Candidatus Thorarchaeota archaeon]